MQRPLRLLVRITTERTYYHILNEIWKLAQSLCISLLGLFQLSNHLLQKGYHSFSSKYTQIWFLLSFYDQSVDWLILSSVEFHRHRSLENQIVTFAGGWICYWEFDSFFQGRIASVFIMSNFLYYAVWRCDWVQGHVDPMWRLSYHSHRFRSPRGWYWRLIWW